MSNKSCSEAIYMLYIMESKFKNCIKRTLNEENDGSQGNGGTMYMPTSNPYMYLELYSRDSNKAQFLVTGAGSRSKGVFKPNSWSKPEGGLIKISGSGKNHEYEVSVPAALLLSLCLGTKIRVKSLKIDGNDVPAEQNMLGKDIEYKIELVSYANTKRMIRIQQVTKNEIIRLYTELPEESKKKVDDLIISFYNKEKAWFEQMNARREAGEIPKATDWSGFYGGSVPQERLINALSSFQTSLLYPVGNAKVSNDTLLVNITSATECPSAAQGTCQVVGPCYAIAQAKFRFQIRHRDRMLHIMNLICLLSDRMDIVRNLIGDYIESAREFGFDIQNIRLNEAGDFIDQKCISAYGRLCGEIRDQYGVKSTAYTARTKDRNGEVMNYADAVKTNDKGVPNIVLTVSRADDESVSGSTGVIPTRYNDETGEVEFTSALNAADRYFLAFPKDEFDKLEDTVVTKNGQPNLQRNDMFITKINPEGWYHKCQCELDKDKTCGDCHVCYEPNLTGKKYFVLCKLHGSAAGRVNTTTLNKKRHFENPLGNNKVSPVELDKRKEWTDDEDQKMRDDVAASPKTVKSKRADADREKELKKVTVQKPKKLQRTVTEEDIAQMVSECIRRIIGRML